MRQKSSGAPEHRRRRLGGVQLAWLAVGLSVVAGATDVLSFMRLGQVFTSVMTGNLVLLGMGIGTGAPTQIINTGSAIGGYVLGAAAGTRIATLPGPPGPVWPRPVTAALCVELATFIGLLAGWEVAGPHPAGWPRLMLAGTAAAAMGIQSAATRRVRIKGLSTTYFTSTLTSVIEDIALSGRRPQVRSTILLLSLAAGACASALLITTAPNVAPALQCSLLTVVIVVAMGGDYAIPRLQLIKK